MSFVNVKLFGDAALSQKLELLGRKAPGLVKKEFRDSAKRIKSLIVASTPVDTGDLKSIVRKQKVRTIPRGRRGIGIGITMPKDRQESIKMFAVEFGTPRAAAKRFIRGTVNSIQDREFRKIAIGIRKRLFVLFPRAKKV